MQHDLSGLSLSYNDREHVPMFGTARCLTILIHFMKGFDLKAREQCVDLVCGVKDHSLVNRPRIMNAEELTSKASSGFDGGDDLIPEYIEMFGFTKWDTQTGMEQVSWWQNDILEFCKCL